MVTPRVIDAVVIAANIFGEMVTPRVIDAVVIAANIFGEMVTPRVIDAVVIAANIFGEMAEWSNAAVSKTVVRQSVDRGFEPPSLRTQGLALGNPPTSESLPASLIYMMPLFHRSLP